MSELQSQPAAKPLTVGQPYFYPDLNCCDGTGCIKSTWQGDIVDYRRLKARIVHLNERSAKAQRDLMITTQGGQVYECAI